ncbi:MAG TPA: hypothetical protein VIH77_06180 [Steroidobacteraceae bacterium]
MAQRGAATPLASIRSWAYSRPTRLGVFAIVGAPNRRVYGTPFAGPPAMGLQA